MAISDNYVPIRQIGNGVTTQFSGNWNMIAAAYALVYYENALTGVQTAVPPGPGAGQYTLTFSASGFTVTYGTAPTAGQYAVIARSVALDQTDPYRTSKGYQGEVLEASLDKLTAICQDITEINGRAIVAPLGDTATSLILPAAAGRALQYIAFDASGNVIVTAGTGTTTPISPAMAPVVAAASLSAARTLLGAAAVGANADITSLTTLASINGGQIAGFRNGLINGAMDVWQEFYSYTPAIGVVTYGADRWCFKRDTNANYTVSRQTGPDGSKYCTRLQRDSATSGTGNIYFGQTLIDGNTTRFVNNKATLRFKARAGANFSSAGGVLSARIQSGTSPNQNVLNGLTGSVDDASLAAVLTTSWQTFTVTSAAVIGASVRAIGSIFNYTPVGTAGAADYFEISEVEIIQGTATDTYYERLDFGIEMFRCMPYVEKSFRYGTQPAQNAGVNTGELHAPATKAGALTSFLPCRFAVPKWTDPVMTLYSPAAASAQLYDETAAASGASTSAIQLTEKGFTVAGNGAAGTAVGNLLGIHWFARAEV